MTWEYLIKEREYEMTKAELDELGEQGWELVTIIDRQDWRGHESIHYFKRRKDD